MTDLEKTFSLESIEKSYEELKQSCYYIRTPVLHHVQKAYNVHNDVDLFLKLENLQVMGSFKIRGVYNQLRQLPPGAGTEENALLAMSAGNYGKAFAFLANQMSLKAKVLIPDTAPDNRAELIKGFGVEVERMPTSELLSKIDLYSKKYNMFHCHSYNDPLVIQGAASLGLEIVEEVPDADVVLVCCGGGALLAATATAIKLSGHTDCRIYGVEPVNSRAMHESFKAGHAVTMEAKSIASGLSPPSAGENAYRLCRHHVEDILLVTDDEIMEAMMVLYERGLKVEASGAAAFAALYKGKVPNVQGCKVVVVITGGNVSVEELSQVHNNVTQLGLNTSVKWL